jgi:hypothetical protein
MKILGTRILGISLAAQLLLLGACGGKKAADEERGTLSNAQAVTVSQTFPSLPGAGGEFASAIAVSGNLAVVGAPGDTNPNGAFTGAAYVLERQADQSWLVKQKLHPASSMVDGVTGQRFGAAVAIDGDTIIVGAPMRP